MKESDADYDRLIAPIESQMMHTVWRILGDPDDADEALQDALVRIWGKLAQIRLATNPHPLVLKICGDAAYDRLRKRIRHRERYRPMPTESTSAEESPSSRAESCEIHRRILESIASLPRNQAIAVMMRIVQGQSYASIATALNCSEPTARTHVARGRARLQEFLTDLRSIERGCFDD